MNTFFKSLVVGSLLVIGSAVAGPSLDIGLSRSLNVDNLRDANLTLAGEVASVRVDFGEMRLSVNGMDPDMASLTLGVAHNISAFDHVNLSIDKHSFGLGLSRDAVIAGALSMTFGVGAVASDVTNLPTLTSSLGLSYRVW